MREQLQEAFANGPEDRDGPLDDIATGLRARFGYDSVSYEYPGISFKHGFSKWGLSIEKRTLCVQDLRGMFGGQIPCLSLDVCWIEDSDQIAHFLIVTLAKGGLDESWMRWDGHDPENVIRYEIDWSTSQD